MKRHAELKQLPQATEIAKSLIRLGRTNKTSIVCSALTLRQIANRTRLEESLLKKIKAEAARQQYLFVKLSSGGFLVCPERKFKNAVEI